MTEIIDLNTRRARPVPDLTKHDTDPTGDDTAPRVLEGVVIPSDGTPTGRPAGVRAAACRGCDAARRHA